MGEPRGSDHYLSINCAWSLHRSCFPTFTLGGYALPSFPVRFDFVEAFAKGSEEGLRNERGSTKSSLGIGQFRDQFG